MNIIPLVSIRKGHIFDGKEGTVASLDDLVKQVQKDTMLYVLDFDGLEGDNPNYELYQRLAEQYILWIDNGPRRLDDVMDTIMAGATNITLRQNLWSDIDMLGVQELTDDEIYLDMSQHHREHKSLHVPYPGEIGVILFNDESMYGGFSKDSTVKQKIFLYVTSTEKAPFWEEQGISGIVIDLQKNKGHPDGF